MFYTNPVFTAKFLYPENKESKLMQTYHYEMENGEKEKRNQGHGFLDAATLSTSIQKKEDRKLNVHT